MVFEILLSNCRFGFRSAMIANEQGFVQVWHSYSACPQPLLIENMLLKLKLMLNIVCQSQLAYNPKLPASFFHCRVFNHIINFSGSAILQEIGCRMLSGFLYPLSVVVTKIALLFPNLCNSLIIAEWSVILLYDMS